MQSRQAEHKQGREKEKDEMKNPLTPSIWKFHKKHTYHRLFFGVPSSNAYRRILQQRLHLAADMDETFLN